MWRENNWIMIMQHSSSSWSFPLGLLHVHFIFGEISQIFLLLLFLLSHFMFLYLSLQFLMRATTSQTIHKLYNFHIGVVEFVWGEIKKTSRRRTTENWVQSFEYIIIKYYKMMPLTHRQQRKKLQLFHKNLLLML